MALLLPSPSVALSPFEWWDWFKYGKASNKDSPNIDEAIISCNKLSELNLHKDQASPALTRGLFWMRKGQIGQAIKDFGIALQKHPNSQFGHFERGKALMKLGDFRRAINDFTEVIKRNSVFESAYYNRGIANEVLGRYKMAQRDFQAAYTFGYSSRDQAIEKMKIYSGEWMEFR